MHRYLAGENAVGHAVRVPQIQHSPAHACGREGNLRAAEIIGVVNDSLDDGLDKPVAPAIYAPYTLVMPPFTQVIVGTQGEPLVSSTAFDSRLLPSTRIAELAGDIRDLQGWIQRKPEFARGRLISMLFGAFAVLALLLAAVGLYSVVSYTVMQRTANWVSELRSVPNGATWCGL